MELNILLYRVGRNLNRAYRTAEAFGVKNLWLLDCNWLLAGNLFKAMDRVKVNEVHAWPPASGLLALETFYEHSIESVRWDEILTIVIGGETDGLPHDLDAVQKAHIPMQGQISGLTVEATLAIALWEWRRNESF